MGLLTLRFCTQMLEPHLLIAWLDSEFADSRLSRADGTALTTPLQCRNSDLFGRSEIVPESISFSSGPRGLIVFLLRLRNHLRRNGPPTFQDHDPIYKSVGSLKRDDKGLRWTTLLLGSAHSIDGRIVPVLQQAILYRELTKEGPTLQVIDGSWIESIRVELDDREDVDDEAIQDIINSLRPWSGDAADDHEKSEHDLRPAPKSRLLPSFRAIEVVASERNQVFGREVELELLNAKSGDAATRVLIVHGLAGYGKTALLLKWLNDLDVGGQTFFDQGFGYSFYRQGQTDEPVDSEDFFTAALTHFGHPTPDTGSTPQKVDRLLGLIAGRRTLFVIDGTEVIQNPPETDRGTFFRDSAFNEFLFGFCAPDVGGLCVITTRWNPKDLSGREPQIVSCALPKVGNEAAQNILRARGVRTETLSLDGTLAIGEILDKCDGLPLDLHLVAHYLVQYLDADPRRYSQIPDETSTPTGGHAERIIAAHEKALKHEGHAAELRTMYALAVFDRPVLEQILAKLQPHLRDSTPSIASKKQSGPGEALRRLVAYGLVSLHEPTGLVNVHPLIRRYFRFRFRQQAPEGWKRANRIVAVDLLRAAPPRLSALVDQSLPFSENRKRQLAAARDVVRAVHHMCEAERWDQAFVLVMSRLDEQNQMCTERMGRLLLPIWRKLTSTDIALDLAFRTGDFLGRKGIRPFAPLYREDGEMDAPFGFYLAVNLQAWDLRLAASAKFYPQSDFTQASSIPDRAASAFADTETAYCLVHIGRTREARRVAQRCVDFFERTPLGPLKYAAVAGLAILELYTGNLDRSIELSQQALRYARTARQIADATAIRAFGRDLVGDTTGADEDFHRSVEQVPRLSKRVAHFHWLSLLRHSQNLDAAEVEFRREASNEPPPNELGTHIDWRTTATKVGLQYLYRRTIETGAPSPRELVDRIDHEYDAFPDHRYNGFYHRTTMQFLRAAGLQLCAALPDAIERDRTRALAAIDSALRHAQSGDFRLVEADTLLVRAKLCHCLGDTQGVATSLQQAIQIARDCNYAWGLEDIQTFHRQTKSGDAE